MPRRNRVTPFGDIIATGAQGLLFGNRGVLHDEKGRREDFVRFRQAWTDIHPGGSRRVDDIDRALHAERIAGGRHPVWSSLRAWSASSSN